MGKIIKVPMLRGRILELKGEPVNEDNVPSEARWVLRGDRGVTYAKNLPENSRLSAGEWWAPDYQGEPLVSFSAEEAGELGLSVGDTITVSVLGRSITLRGLPICGMWNGNRCRSISSWCFRPTRLPALHIPGWRHCRIRAPLRG
jgi:hypothetical protein